MNGYQIIQMRSDHNWRISIFHPGTNDDKIKIWETRLSEMVMEQLFHTEVQLPIDCTIDFNFHF